MVQGVTYSGRDSEVAEEPAFEAGLRWFESIGDRHISSDSEVAEEPVSDTGIRGFKSFQNCQIQLRFTLCEK